MNAQKSRAPFGAQHKSDGPPRRVLIVDDEPTVRDLVTHVAKALGYEITVAVNGREGVEHIERSSFDVVVTDIYMPERDGFELIRHLRAVRPAPKIIAVSGGGEFGFNALRPAVLLGAAHILHKPFDVAELIELLRTVPQRAATGRAGR